MLALHGNVCYVIMIYMVIFSNCFICVSLSVYTLFPSLDYNLLFIALSEHNKVRRPVGLHSSRL